MPIQSATGVLSQASVKHVIESWQLSFVFPASTAAGTTEYAAITRTPGTPGAISVSTSSLPFYLPPQTSGVILDAYINSLQAGLNGSAYLNFWINDVDQRMAIDIASYNSTIAGRKAPVARSIDAGSQFRAGLTNANATAASATTQIVLLDVQVFFK
jgi:hypothetical protein